MGCATAQALAQRGADVVVLERAVPGAEASSAAAGILGGQAELHGREQDLARFIRARSAWPRWVAELREATGIDVGYRKSGVLRVALSEVERFALAREVDWQASRGLVAAMLDADTARLVEPEVGPDVVGAAHFADDAQVNPPSVLRALLVLLSRDPRVQIRPGTTVQRLIFAGDRCAGVRIDDGELEADATVLAAGSWSSLVGGVPTEWPRIRPVRGQIVELEQRPPRVGVIVFGPGGYVVPRGDGRVICGSTVEHVGFRREVTAEGVASILANALACVPSLARAQFVATWNNFRPHVDGDRPMVGPSSVPGLFLATGHHRNGILLAKATAEDVAGAVTESR
jgi:glycine oxidase